MRTANQMLVGCSQARKSTRSGQVVRYAPDRDEGGTGMDRFEGRIAVVTGGGIGDGARARRASWRPRAATSSTCDVSAEHMDETRDARARRRAGGHAGHARSSPTSPTSRRLVAFAADVAERSTTPTTSTCCSTTPGSAAAAASSPTTAPSGSATFAICWDGVYGTLARVHADAAGQRRRATSSTPAASTGSGRRSARASPHTAYSAAKFAVKGFTEALITDFRINAPHLKASVVMPGHIGTSIVDQLRASSLGRDPKELTHEQLADLRERLAEARPRHVRMRATRTSASACRRRPRRSATTRR